VQLTKGSRLSTGEEENGEVQIFIQKGNTTLSTKSGTRGAVGKKGVARKMKNLIPRSGRRKIWYSQRKKKRGTSKSGWEKKGRAKQKRGRNNFFSGDLNSTVKRKNNNGRRERSEFLTMPKRGI